MGWFSSAVHAIGHAAESVGSTIEHGAEDAGSAIKDGAEDAGSAIVDGAKDVGDAAEDIGSAALHETENLGTQLAKVGIDVGEDMATAAKWAGNVMEEGAEKTYEGMVAAGKFISENACSIAVGTALGTAVAALAADGEEEGGMAALAIAAKAANTAEIQAAATLISSGVTDVVWKIPGVSSSGVPEGTVKQVLKYTIVMAVKEKTSEVAVTGGQYIIGALLTVLTGLICTGDLPGGFKVWEGSSQSF